MTPALILLVSSVALLAACAGLFAADRAARAKRARVTAVVAAYAPARSTARAASGPRRPGSGPFAPLARLLGIEPDRRDLYPAPWPVILLIAGVITLVITGVATLVIGTLAWALYLPLGLLVSRAVFGRFKAKRTQTLYTQLPDALQMIVRSVRAGLPVPEALRVVAEEAPFPTSAEFGRIWHDLRLGQSLPDALRAQADRSTLLEYRFFAVALTLQSQAGGNLTETLENLADIVRRRVALRQRAIALSAEARMSMAVLGAIPFVAIAALFAVSPDYILQLFRTDTGNVLLGVAALLLAMGYGSMKTIIAKSLA